MKIVEAEARIRYPNTQDEWNYEINNIAGAALISRGAEHSDRPPEELVRRLIRKRHLSVLEFGSMTVAFTLDRAIANELTRHRHISCVQESTRYVPYLYDIPVIKPSGISPDTMMYDLWEDAALVCEHAYHEAIQHGLEPEYARSMLPNCLATHLIVKANFREWRHILKLRTDKSAHPDMRDVMSKLAARCAGLCPAVFEGIMAYE